MPSGTRDRVFVSYSHVDAVWRDKLHEVLAADIRNDRIDYWDDRELNPGDPWFQRIIDAIARARVALLLVSPSFLSSSFVLKEELPRIIDAVADGLTLIWVPLSGDLCGPDGQLSVGPLSTFQAAFDPREPLAALDATLQVDRLLAIGNYLKTLLTGRRFRCKLPFGSLARLFKGRDDEFARIDEFIADGSPSANQPLVISGLPGVGKTRLAVEYAWHSRDRRSALLFVSANTPDELNDNLARLSAPDALDLPEYKFGNDEDRRSAVIRWLQQNDDWLAIIDNVDTPEAVKVVQGLVALLDRGRVLITSRQTLWGGGVARLSLDVMPLADAVALLLGASERQRLADREDDNQAAILAERLGRLPLALTHAAAYLSYYGLGIGAYLREFEENTPRVLEYHDDVVIEYDPEPSRAGMRKTVRTTFFMSFDRLSRTAKAILRATSLLGAAPVPFDLFERCGPQVAAFTHIWIEETQVEVSVRDAIAELARFSLIIRGDRSFSIHPFERAIIYSSLAPAQGRDCKDIIREMLLAYAPADVSSPATWPIWEALAPHIEHVASWQPHPDTATHADVVKLIQDWLFWKGAYARATPYAQTLVEYREREFGRDHEGTAESLHDLAVLLVKQGDVKTAQPLICRVIELRERTLGAEHPDTLASLSEYACILALTGDLDHSEQLFQRALTIRERVLGRKHKDTLRTLNDLGWLLDLKGQSGDAEPLYREAMEGWTMILGPENPETLSAMHNLATSVQKQGRVDEAASIIRQATTVSIRILGRGHPVTRACLQVFASVLESTEQPANPQHLGGDVVAAARLCRELLEVSTELFGTDDRPTLIFMNHLASLLELHGDLSEGADLNRRLLACLERALGDTHSENLAALGVLTRSIAFRLFRNGDYSSAEKLLRLLLKKGFEPESMRCHLARLLILTGHEVEARAQIKEASTYATETPPYITARILFFSILWELVDGREVRSHLVQLRELLAMHDAHAKWSIDPVIDHFSARLSKAGIRLLSAVATAINSPMQLPQLEEFLVSNELSTHDAR